jgi:hypothetical protein
MVFNFVQLGIKLLPKSLMFHTKMKTQFEVRTDEEQSKDGSTPNWISCGLSSRLHADTPRQFSAQSFDDFSDVLKIFFGDF